jgi:PRC-barrel domain
MSGTDDLGAPVSYLALEEGTAVLTADGEQLGHVAHVLADEETDIFDGIVIAHGVGRHTFADAEQVAEIHERGVMLTLTTAEAEALPEPSENPAVMEDDPSEQQGSARGNKLRRAWDLLSGNY